MVDHQQQPEEQQHTPSPQESRGIYGFALFLMMNCCTLAYFGWTVGLPLLVVGTSTSTSTWLPYEPPQPYWGLAVPVFLCTALATFAFALYPALHSSHDPKDLHDLATVTDQHSVSQQSQNLSNFVQHFDNKKKKKNQSKEEICRHQPIAPAFDMELDEVCKMLYLKNTN
jgi:hypothetical protein